MGDNPISKADPLGDTLVSQNDKEVAKETTQAVNKRKEDVKKDTGKNIGKLYGAFVQGMKITQKEVNAAKKNVEQNNKVTKQLDRTLKDIATITNDPNHGYTFNESPTPGQGELSVNDDGTISLNASNDKLRVHEIAHAADVANGNAVVKDGAIAVKAGYDEGVYETKGYRAQFAMGNEDRTFPNDAGNVNSLDEITPEWFQTIREKNPQKY